MVNVSRIPPLAPLLSQPLTVSHALSRLLCASQDLVAREEAFKKSKLASASTNSNPNNSSAQETSIQSAGRRLREEAAAAAHAADDFARSEAKRVATLSSKPKPSTSNPGSSSETITDLDLTLRLSLPLPTYAHLVIPDALESLLLAKYGKVDTVVLLPGKPPKKSSKSNGEAKEQASAMIIFTRTNLGGCWALWEDCRAGRAGWEGVKAKWANKGVEPEWVARLGKGGDGSGAASTAGQNGAASSTPPPPPTEGGVPSFSFDPTAAMGTPASTTTTAPPQAAEEDYENSTLLRMRQAERERLEREIREADEMEEA